MTSIITRILIRLPDRKRESMTWRMDCKNVQMSHPVTCFRTPSLRGINKRILNCLTINLDQIAKAYLQVKTSSAQMSNNRYLILLKILDRLHVGLPSSLRIRTHNVSKIASRVAVKNSKKMKEMRQANVSHPYLPNGKRVRLGTG
jgi:hypothetical protein